MIFRFIHQDEIFFEFNHGLFLNLFDLPHHTREQIFFSAETLVEFYRVGMVNLHFPFDNSFLQLCLVRLKQSVEVVEILQELIQILYSVL